MADHIKVSTQNIRRDQENIQNEMEGLTKSISELYQEMKALGSVWDGPAWNAFQKQTADDIENMKTVCDKIAGFLRHMKYAETEYRKCDAQIEGIVEGIRI